MFDDVEFVRDQATVLSQLVDKLAAQEEQQLPIHAGSLELEQQQGNYAAARLPYQDAPAAWRELGSKADMYAVSA